MANTQKPVWNGLTDYSNVPPLAITPNQKSQENALKKFGIPKEIYNIVQPIFYKYGIPDSVFLPIMKTENGDFNPKKWAVNSKEKSGGLYQINLLAHPEYSVSDVENVAKSTEIISRDFLSPIVKNQADRLQKEYPNNKDWAIMMTGGKSDKLNLIEYLNYTMDKDTVSKIYKNAFHPAWTNETEKRIKDNSQTFFETFILSNIGEFDVGARDLNSIVQGWNINLGDYKPSSILNNLFKKSTGIDEVYTNIKKEVIIVAFYLILVLFILVVVFKSISSTDAGKDIIEVGKTTMMKGVI